MFVVLNSFIKNRLTTNRGGVALPRKPAISLERDKIGPRLIDHQQEIAHALSIGAKINDL